MKLLIESEKEIVCEVVCAHFGIAHVDLHKSTRAERVSKPRQVVFYLLHRILGASVANIARSFEKDYGTIRWGIEATLEAISVDATFARTLVFLEERCRLMLNAKEVV